MKNIFLPLMFFSLTVHETRAQQAPIAQTQPTSSSNSINVFKKGTVVLSGGIGFGVSYYSAGYYDYSTTPALCITADYGVADISSTVSFGIGGIVAYTSTSAHDGFSTDTYTWTSGIIAGRGSFHENIAPQFCIYEGAMAGLRFYSFSDVAGSQTSTSQSLIAVGVYVGGNYFFTKNIGIFGEVGYDVSIIKGGLSFKF